MSTTTVLSQCTRQFGVSMELKLLHCIYGCTSWDFSSVFANGVTVISILPSTGFSAVNFYYFIVQNFYHGSLDELNSCESSILDYLQLQTTCNTCTWHCRHCDNVIILF